MDRVVRAYKLLGIAAGAPLNEVTRAYRLLAKKYHPDSNPGSGDTAQTMMMRINDAYEIIKDYLSRGGGLQEKPPYTQSAKGRARSASAQEEQRRQRAREQYRKEREAFTRYWQQRLEEREREESDLKSYRLVLKHLFSVISDLYADRLHQAHIRERPFNRIAYEAFLGKYEILMEKSEKLSRTALSKKYRKKFKLVSEFLLVFLGHLEQGIHESAERRASALHRFNEALNERDRFLSLFFADLHFERGEMINGLKRLLGSFEGFVKAYPSSPLIDYSEVTVDVLQHLYRAFLKENAS